MLQRFISFFIKEPDKIHDKHVRSAYGTLTSIVGFILNIVLFAVKITIGILVQSISITADAWNNLSDAGSSLISLVGIHLSKKPADQEHPFGHGRYEYITALIIAFLILLVGVNIVKDSINKILHPKPIAFNLILIIILILSILIKIFLSVFNYYVGRKINSSLLKATAMDARNDVFITTGTVISFSLEHFFSIPFDGWVGLVIALFVIYSSFDIVKTTLKPLLGQAVDQQLYQQITSKVMSYPGIVGSHDLITHNYGPTNIMATIHVEITSDHSMEAVHNIVHQIEQDIEEEFNIALLIHVDPVIPGNEKVQKNRDKIQSLIYRLEPQATIHDYQVRIVDQHLNISFDLVVPYSYQDEEKKALIATIEQNVKRLNPSFVLEIHIENSFIAEE